MTETGLAARAVIGAAALALSTLAALHVARPDLNPSSTMISQYARGPHGWAMGLCFAAFAAGSACLFALLVTHTSPPVGRIGLALLLAASVGFAMAAIFPMDPVSTATAQMSFSGKMHGLSFLLGVPAFLLAALLVSLALGRQTSHASLPLLALTTVIWLSQVVVFAIMLMVGPGKPPDPDGLERFLGWPNRLGVVAYGVWLMVAAWPLAL